MVVNQYKKLDFQYIKFLLKSFYVPVFLYEKYKEESNKRISKLRVLRMKQK